MIVQAFLLIVFIALMTIVIFYMIKAMSSLAPWIPSKTTVVAQAFAIIQPSPKMRFVDLGCGDGRIVFFVNRKYGLESTGFEFSPLPYFIAKLRQLKYINKPVSIQMRDLYTVPIAAYDIIFVYGLPQTIQKKIEQKLAAEAKHGSYLVSYNFALKNKKTIAEIHDHWRNVYIYRF